MSPLVPQVRLDAEETGGFHLHVSALRQMLRTNRGLKDPFPLSGTMARDKRGHLTGISARIVLDVRSTTRLQRLLWGTCVHGRHSAVRVRARIVVGDRRPQAGCSTGDVGVLPRPHQSGKAPNLGRKRPLATAVDQTAGTLYLFTDTRTRNSRGLLSRLT